MAAEPLPPLLARKKLIGATQETTSGTFATVATPLAANYYDVKCEPGDFFNEGARAPAGNYVGDVPSVLGKQSGKLTFKVDITPGGVILALLTGAGYKLTSTTYAPNSDLSTRKTWSFKVWEDGRCKKLAGCTIKFTLDLQDGNKLVANCEAEGIWLTPIDEAMPARAPITAAPYICRGITLTMATAAIAHVNSATVDLGAQTEEREAIAGNSQGIAHYLVGEISPKITLDPEARKVADHDAYGLYLAGGTTAIVIALASGTNTLTITAATAQRTKVSDGTRGKRLTDPIEMMCTVSSGDDALTIIES